MSYSECCKGGSCPVCNAVDPEDRECKVCGEDLYQDDYGSWYCDNGCDQEGDENED